MKYKKVLSFYQHYLNLMSMKGKNEKYDEIKAHSLYFAKMELEERRRILTINILIKNLKDKIDKQQELYLKYNYDLAFLKIYNRINNH